MIGFDQTPQALREHRQLEAMHQDRQCFPRFTAWLYRHRHENSWLGDVARDAYDDPDWPEHACTFQEYEQYLLTVGASFTFMGAFERAWARYTGRPLLNG